MLDIILEPGGMSPVYQPIFKVAGNDCALHAVESLIRGPQGTNMQSPVILFEYVRRKGAEKTVDRACVRAALAEYPRLLQGVLLSINVHASTLERDREFANFLQSAAEANSFDPKNLIIEIVESVSFWDRSGFTATLEELRSLGVAIALDDIGVGQSNYRMLLESRPDYFKVDRHIVNGVYSDPFRQAVLESVLLLAGRFNARVVAEGVEQKKDLDTLLEIGIDLIQGYLLSLPLESARLVSTSFAQSKMGEGEVKAVSVAGN